MAASKDYEQLIYCPRTHDIGVFTEQAEAAKDAGFTHIYISGLTGRTDYQGDDADSPWSAAPTAARTRTAPGASGR